MPWWSWIVVGVLSVLSAICVTIGVYPGKSHNLWEELAPKQNTDEDKSRDYKEK